MATRKLSEPAAGFAKAGRWMSRLAAAEAVAWRVRAIGFAVIALQLIYSATPGRTQGAKAMTLELYSTAFLPKAGIPRRYTCDGADVSPLLSWRGLPEGTESLVLIVDDPDAPDPANPKMTWVHWVLYNLPASTTALPEAVETLPRGTKEGLNDWKRTGYGGPCPPIGRHRYFFKLFALDVVLPDLGKATKVRIEEAMAPHVLAMAVLMGTYQH